MIGIESLLNSLTIVITIVFSSIGVAIGGSIASIAATQAINIQPNARADITKTMILGMALIETAAIIGLVIAILLLLVDKSLIVNPYYWGLSNLGILFSVSFSGFIIGLASSFPVKYACFSVARQPFFSNKILNLMMLSLSFLQTPIIFGFIIAFLIHFQAPAAKNLVDSLKFIGSGLSIGLGCIGPVIGLTLFAKEACKGIGVNRHAYGKIITFTFVSQALIETPVVFSLITSLLLITSSPSESLLYGVAMLSAALCTGISNLVPGFSSGRTAASACNQIATNPEIYSLVSRASLLAQGLLDTFSIYGWLVSLLLILYTRNATF